MFVNVFVHIPKCAGGTIQNHIEAYYPEDQRFGPHHPFYKQKISQSLNFWSRWQCLRNKTYVKRSWINTYVSSLSLNNKNTISYIYGHAAYYGIHEPFNREPRYFTFLRDPLPRFISFYNYVRTIRVTPDRLIKNEIHRKDGTIRSIDEWLGEVDLNIYSMSNFLLQIYRAEKLLASFSSLNKFSPHKKDILEIKKMLASFYFVGLTEKREDMDFVLGSLGINTFLPDKNVLREKDTYMMPQDMGKARKIVEEKCPMDVELYEYAKALNLKNKEEISNYTQVVAQASAKRKQQA